MKKQLLNGFLMVLLAAANGPALALAIAEIELHSGLNQVLDATIEIPSATSQELDNLNLSIGRLPLGSAYNWPGLLVELVRLESGRNYLKLTSKEVIREPVLEFLLELSWNTGRLQREYALLVNPQF